MPFKFNPFTGTLDLVGTSSSSVRSFNVYSVAVSDTVEIQDGDENIVSNPQTVDGILTVNGRNTVL